MQQSLLFLIMAVFAAMLILNFYFRVKVLRAYKKLLQHGVEFDSSHFLSKQKMEKEIYPKYPHLKKDIAAFVQHIQYSVKMATVLIALITLFVGVLMYLRNSGL